MQKKENTQNELSQALRQLADAKLEAQGIDIEKYRHAEKEFMTTLKEIAKKVPSPDVQRLQMIRQEQLDTREFVRKSELALDCNKSETLSSRQYMMFPSDRFIYGFRPSLYRCAYVYHTDACSNLQSSLSGDHFDLAPQAPSEASTTPPCTAHAVVWVQGFGDGHMAIATHSSSCEYSGLTIPDDGTYCGRALVSISGVSWALGGPDDTVILTAELSCRLTGNNGRHQVYNISKLLFWVQLPLYLLGAPGEPELIYLDEQHTIGTHGELRASDAPFELKVTCRISLLCYNNTVGLLSTKGGAGGVFFDGVDWGPRLFQY